MFSSASLLVLVCASAIAFKVDPPPDKCITARIGTAENSFPVQLPPIPLPPFLIDIRVKIPTIPECVFGETGVVAKVCDTDVPPSAHFENFNTLDVHRNGAALFTGSVTVTIYCRII